MIPSIGSPRRASCGAGDRPQGSHGHRVERPNQKSSNSTYKI